MTSSELRPFPSGWRRRRRAESWAAAVRIYAAERGVDLTP